VSEVREGFVPNPVLAGLMGICPLIAASRSLAEGAIYGLGTAICAIALGAIAPPLRATVADRLQAPATLAISAAVSTLFAFCVRAYSPAIAAGLWIYLPLLSVSGLSLYALRRTSLPGRYGPDASLRFATLSLESILFFLTAAFVGGLREFIGLGSLTLPTPGPSPLRIDAIAFPPMRLLVSPAGGFMLLGLLVAVYRALARSGRRLWR
jgi:electron transport complex protein RnfE